MERDALPVGAKAVLAPAGLQALIAGLVQPWLSGGWTNLARRRDRL